MLVTQEDSSLVTQCLDFCRHLATQSKDFNISIKLGSFSFSLDTMEKTNTTKVVMKKKLSPASRRRNTRRREEFLKKKLHTKSDSGAPAAQSNIETTRNKSMESTSKTSFMCDQCDSEFDNEKGLRCHQGKMHKVTLSPIPQIDGQLLHLLYDQPPASVIHPERGRGFYHDTEPDRIYCYKFSNGQICEC